MSINNNTFTYSLISGTEPSTVRYSDISNKSNNNKGKGTTYFYNNNNDDNNPPNLLEFIININPDKPVNIENLTVNINFLNYYFDNNR